MTSSLINAENRLAVPVNDQDHIVGPDDAPVTLVEYGDYQCPYCGMAHPIVQKLLAVREGRVRLVYRHFPLSNIHPYAEVAAEAAEMAGTRGRFWLMHDWLFTNQERLSPLTVLAGLVDLGLDGEEAAEALRTHRHLPKVRSDFVGGVHSGVNGTPSFFINGVRHQGGFSLPDLAAAVDHATV